MTNREGVAGEELAGIGVGGPPQSTSEAEEAEANRRAEMSEVELEEAAMRDRAAEDLAPKGRAKANLGSPDEEGREDSNTDRVAKQGQTFGTGPDERTAP